MGELDLWWIYILELEEEIVCFIEGRNVIGWKINWFFPKPSTASNCYVTKLVIGEHEGYGSRVGAHEVVSSKPHQTENSYIDWLLLAYRRDLKPWDMEYPFCISIFLGLHRHDTSSATREELLASEKKMFLGDNNSFLIPSIARKTTETSLPNYYFII